MSAYVIGAAVALGIGAASFASVFGTTGFGNGDLGLGNGHF